MQVPPSDSEPPLQLNQIEMVTLNDRELNTKNLSLLDDAELDQYKRAMDIDFLANQIKPGSADFVYNKVVDFSRKPDDIEMIE